MNRSCYGFPVRAVRQSRCFPFQGVVSSLAAILHLILVGFVGLWLGPRAVLVLFAAVNVGAAWYVDSVMLRAQLIGGLPDVLLGSLTGLTQGHFPVAAPARYADDPAAQAKKLARTRNGSDQSTATGVHIYAREGSPVIAVQDGEIVSIGSSPNLGKFVRLRDAYGNTYTYAHLKSIVSTYPVPKPVAITMTGPKSPVRALPGAFHGHHFTVTWKASL